MSEFICPLCEQVHGCEQLKPQEPDFTGFNCKTYNVGFSLSNKIIKLNDNELKEKLLNLVTEHLLHNKYCGKERWKWHFIYSPSSKALKNNSPQYINLAEQMINYPENTLDIANRSLINLSIQFPNYGDVIYISYTYRRIIFEQNDNNGILEILDDMGYLKFIGDSTYLKYKITAQGWKKIDELRKQNLTLKQAFIAMQFGEKTKNIREAFRTAITESGYNVRIIDEKEHNNQIVPEIFFEIKRSLFAVVDVTFQNYGAYYEAGYAQALGKEVIVCCRADEFNNPETRPHFDIAQKSMIVWKDEHELIVKLKRRIEATVK